MSFLVLVSVMIRESLWGSLMAVCLLAGQQQFLHWWPTDLALGSCDAAQYSSSLWRDEAWLAASGVVGVRSRSRNRWSQYSRKMWNLSIMVRFILEHKGVSFSIIVSWQLLLQMVLAPSQAKPSQAKVLTEGRDLHKAQVNVPLSVQPFLHWLHRWAP
jgi:hypothetical protein